ncbi:MAG: hypothetical protein LBD37_08365 [Treponema sp.]|nr:hypothetical protein [Treponema sp.]
MKKLMLAALTVPILFFAACAGGPKAGKSGVVEETTEYVVVNHKGKDFGGVIPEWVTRYETEDIHSVEALSQYAEKYIFIGRNVGKNLTALQQWTRNFSVAQEMSQMVSQRVDAKFKGAAVGSPETAYGSYYQNVVANVSKAEFSGARQTADYWILRRYKTDNREEYTYYVLVEIDKKVMERQINEVLNGTPADPTPEQQTAIDLVKQSFYEGF